MTLWVPWMNAVRSLRPACQRSRTFLWLLLTLIGLCCRLDLAGVTSYVRVLGLRPEAYHRFLHLFHSKGLDLDKLTACWMKLWGAYVAGLMWSPGFAALLTCKLLRRDLSGIGWGWGETRYEVIGYLIPLGYSIVIYGFVWLTGLGGFYNRGFVDQITNSFGLGP